MINIKIKRLTDTAKLPTKAHDSDACYDIYIDEPDYDIITIPSKGSVLLHTGFATEIPDGYFCAVFPRSGLGIKNHLRLSNGTGIIDSHYRGEWMVSLYNDGVEDQVINHGSRVAQFAILPVLESRIVEVNDLSESDRGTGGFGSTGKQ